MMKLANYLKRTLSALLVAAMLVGVLPVTAFAAGETTYVVACSDFQNKSGDSAGANTVTSILNTIRNNGYTIMDRRPEPEHEYQCFHLRQDGPAECGAVRLRHRHG